MEVTLFIWSYCQDMKKSSLNAGTLNQGFTVFPYICVFHFSILVSVAPQKCNFVWYISKHGVAHNPMLHYRHLTFVLSSLFLAEHTSPNSLTLHKPMSDFSDGDSSACLSHVIARTGSDWTVELKTDKSMNLKFKTVTKKSLQQKGHLPLVPYCTKQRNECLYAFLSSPTDCIRTQHLDKPALPRKLNTL
jgi:hypothetical protein